MKFLKNTLPLIALCTLYSLDAKVSGAAPAIRPQPTPVRRPVSPVAQPPAAQPQVMQQHVVIPQPQSYAQALDLIKTKIPSAGILVNNTFTENFITFIQSLNFSAIETRALLEAAANIHAVWTDNNEANKRILSSLQNTIDSIMHSLPRGKRVQPRPLPQPPAVQPQPIKKIEPAVPQIAPMKEHFLTNNLVMTLDPEKVESVNTVGGSMVQQALLTLYEKAAPIIVTSNILEIIIKVQQQIGDTDLKKLRTVDIQHITSLAHNIQQSHNVTTMPEIALILLSYINFDSRHLNCYFHKSAPLVLLIPKEYIQTNLPQAMHFNLNDQAKVCGFNPGVLTPLPDITPAHLINEINAQQAQRFNKKQFIANLTAMFIPQKKNGELISPENDTKWLIYLTGHGGPAFLTIGHVRQQLNMIKQSLSNAQKNIRMGFNVAESQKYLAKYEPRAQEYEKMVQGRSSWLDSQLVPESAHIAGISAPEFSQLMKFFDASLNVAYVHYTTCFSGGSNQTFVNDVLSSLDVNFIVSSEGAHEGYTTSALGIQMSTQEPRIRLTRHSYGEFFRLLRLFFTQPEQYVKIKGKQKDPIINILRTINPEFTPQNQPFVRFPGAGFFAAVSINKETEVLTRTKVKAHAIEKRPFDVSNKNIGTIILATPRITVPLNVGKKMPALVSPSPKALIPAYEAIHVFKEINWQGTLQSLLFNCIYANARYYTQTFIVEKLTGIVYQKSGLAGKGAITNLIIQMKGIAGTGSGAGAPVQFTPLQPQDIKLGTVGLNIQIAFELDNVIHHRMFAVKNFDNADAISQSLDRLTFTATPLRSMNMNTLASNFLTSQEITQVAKPITLESIIRFIDSKIDTQNRSMALQSEADNEALKFA